MYSTSLCTMLNCYSYNYSLIALKCVWLFILIAQMLCHCQLFKEPIEPPDPVYQFSLFVIKPGYFWHKSFCALILTCILKDDSLLYHSDYMYLIPLFFEREKTYDICKIMAICEILPLKYLLMVFIIIYNKMEYFN